MLVTALPHHLAHLADDTEESLVGSSLHQDAISTAYTSLKLCGPARGRPWFVGNQLQLIIARDGAPPYRPSPDLLVHPTLGMGSRNSLIVGSDGAPALVIEVASPSTATNDIDLEHGKAAAYMGCGVAEYLVFDPTGAELGTQVWACRARAGGGSEVWTSESDGHYLSSALGIGLAPQGVLLRVYDEDGTLVPLATEQALRIAELEAEIARLRRER